MGLLWLVALMGAFDNDKSFWDLFWTFAFILLCLLGIWKFVEIIIWLVKHVNISIGIN